MKYYVLDTNVLLYDANAIFKFEGEDNVIVIPITVIEEVDRFKKHLNETGRNARQFSRNIEKLRVKGDITKGIKLENRSTLLIKIPKEPLNKYTHYPFMGDEGDNRILSTACEIKENIKDDDEIFFITKDINLRIKASAIGLNAIDYEEKSVKFQEFFQGYDVVMVSDEFIENLYRKKETEEIEKIEKKLSHPIYPNQFFLFKSEIYPNNQAIGIYKKQKNKIILINTKFLKEKGIWGIKPKNLEQIMAFHLLLDDEIKLVTLLGKAGTGKTLLALASGLQKVIDEEIYNKLVTSRPIFPLGKDLGFLPGDVEKKLQPWMQPIYDNLDFIIGINNENRKDYEFLIQKKIIEIEPLTYIRGRSIANQFLIVDEAQNLTPHEIKTIITRAGDNTKIILTGDPYQIDNPYVDFTSNGLSYVSGKFLQYEIAGSITLIKGERSPLAELAAEVL